MGKMARDIEIVMLRRGERQTVLLLIAPNQMVRIPASMLVIRPSANDRFTTQAPLLLAMKHEDAAPFAFASCYQTHLGVRNLPIASLMAKLTNGLNQVVQPMNVGLGKEATVDIHWQPAISANLTISDESAGLTLCAVAQIFELGQHKNSERIVQL
jgi:hypothetical protein